MLNITQHLLSKGKVSKDIWKQLSTSAAPKKIREKLCSLLVQLDIDSYSDDSDDSDDSNENSMDLS